MPRFHACIFRPLILHLFIASFFVEFVPLGICSTPSSINGERDCHDSSDEKDCPAKPCPQPDNFRCVSGTCIPSSWRCDQVADCPDDDHSDEHLCNSNCKPGQFKCDAAAEHDCISSSWVCDGEEDCADGSDERQNCAGQCGETDDEFRCRNDRCIRQNLRCNWLDDCGDNSDEIRCPPHVPLVAPSTSTGTTDVETTTILSNRSTSSPPLWVQRPTVGCSSDKFWCLTGECLSFDEVCNGQANCADGSDEGDGCEEPCVPDRHGCHHTCHQSPGGPICSCMPGYRLSREDSKSCENIDECEVGKMCDQYCQNLKGSFKCTCHQEYILKPDHTTCKARGSPALFVYWLNSQIIVAKKDLSVQRRISVPEGLIGLDVDAANRQLYWSNERTGVIGRTSIYGNSSETVIEGLAMPGLMVYDWVSNNVLVIDDVCQGSEERSRLTMKICSLNNNPMKRGCAVLYVLWGQEVTSIAVVPEQSYVFWTSIFQNSPDTKRGAIKRGAMDGSGVKTLASDKIIKPADVVIDHVFNRVYWIDTATRTIESINFDGTGRTVLVSTGQSSLKVTNLAIFEGWLIFNEEGINVQCRMHRPLECEKIYDVADGHHLVLLQKSLQPLGKDPCKNSTCNFICTGKASHDQLSNDSTSNHVCLCPENMAEGQEATTNSCYSNKQPESDDPQFSYHDDDISASNNSSSTADDSSSVPWAPFTHVAITVGIISVIIAVLGIFLFNRRQKAGQKIPRPRLYGRVRSQLLDIEPPILT